MPIVQSNTGLTFPTLLQLASRIRREVAKESLTSLVDDPINNCIVDSINDAVADIYNRTLWWWQKISTSLTMVAAQSEYAIPADFYRMASPIVIGGSPLREVEYEQWERYTYTPSPGISTGTPKFYMVDRALIKFYPTPDATSIALYPLVTLMYIKGPSARLTLALSSASAPNLPNEFIEAVVRFGMARLKIMLQEDDYGMDEKRYEALIATQIENNFKSVFPPRSRPRSWRSASFG